MSARYPKRKRASITYTEPTDEVEGLEDQKADVVAAGTSKTAKAADAADAADATDITDDDEEEYGARPRKKAKITKRASRKKKVPPPPPEPKPFPFMSLPAELRNEIYKLALTDPSGVHVNTFVGAYTNRARHVSPPNCLWWRSKIPLGQWLEPDGVKITDGLRYKPKDKLAPALLATSKTINAEAAGMFWTQKFYFSDPTALHHFLVNLRPQSKALLRDITIIQWQGSRNNSKHSNFPAMHLLSDVLNLQRLRIHERIFNQRHSLAKLQGPIGDQGRAAKTAEHVLRDCHPWVRAMVKAHGEDKVTQVLKISEDNYKPDSHYSNTPATAWTEQRHKDAQEHMFKMLFLFSKSSQ